MKSSVLQRAWISHPSSSAAYSTFSLSSASSTLCLLLSLAMFHSPTASNILVSPLQVKLHLHHLMKWPLKASLQIIYPATCSHPASTADWNLGASLSDPLCLIFCSMQTQHYMHNTADPAVGSRCSLALSNTAIVPSVLLGSRTWKSTSRGNCSQEGLFTGILNSVSLLFNLFLRFWRILYNVF